MSHTPVDRTSSQSGVALVSLVVVIMSVLAIVAAAITLELENHQAATDQSAALQADLVAQSALHTGFREISSLTDATGFGLGAIGLGAPEPFADGSGAIFGEFRTYVVNHGDGTADLRAIAAVPSFQSPRAVRCADARIGAVATWEFTPRPGAMVISGPSSALDLQWTANGTNVLIDGGEAPAISTTDATSFDLAMNGFGSLVEDGTLDGSEFMGSLTSTYTTGTGSYDLPIFGTEIATQDIAEMNAYRTGIRDAAIAQAATAALTINSPVIGNQAWGSALAPQITYIDTTGLVNSDIFASDGQTVTGYGTLIIRGDVRARMNLNLDWHGDIIVIGDSAGGMNLMQFHGTNAVIDGSIIFVAENNGEGSVQLDDSMGTAPRPTDFVVNGAMVMVSDVSNRKVELSIDKTSSLEVNGILGMMGSEINLVAQTADTSLTVNGSLALQMPVDTGPGQLHNPLSLRLAGDVHLEYDQELARAASSGLGALEAIYGVTGDDQLIIDRFLFLGLVQNPVSDQVALVQFQSFVPAATSSTEYGYDPSFITATPTGPGNGGGGSGGGNGNGNGNGN